MLCKTAQTRKYRESMEPVAELVGLGLRSRVARSWLVEDKDSIKVAEI